MMSNTQAGTVKQTELAALVDQSRRLSRELADLPPTEQGHLLLIIEDELHDRTAYERMFQSDRKLSTMFEDIVYAHNFQEARACIARRLPDCCLMDFQLPEGRANEFIQALYEEGLWFPIVISTGVGSERLVVELMQLGVQDYLTKDDLSAPMLAHTLRNAMTTFHLETEIYHRAHVDGLTGLANRVTFTARLREAVDQARRYMRRLCLLYIDVDNFKPVNDEYGHEWGDVLLAQVAQRLRGSIRQTDLAARLGGDEFVLLLLEADVSHGLMVAEKLFSAMAEPISYGGQKLKVSLSVGLADFPASASDEKELLAHADVALYKAKARGKAQYATFSQEDVIAWRERKLLKKLLPVALENDEVSVRFLPLFDVKTGQCELVSASLHWETPSFGLKNDQIFALATEAATHTQLISWFIRECISQLDSWREAAPDLAVVLPLRVDMLHSCSVRDTVLAMAQNLSEGAIHSIMIPADQGQDAHDALSWGVRPLLSLDDCLARPKNKLRRSFLDLASDSACRFGLLDDHVLRRAPSAQAREAIVRAVSEFANPLGLTILSTESGVCLVNRSPIRNLQMMPEKSPQPIAPCPHWLEFLDKAQDLGVTIGDACTKSGEPACQVE